MTRQNDPFGSGSRGGLVPQPRGRDVVSSSKPGRLISRVAEDALVTLKNLALTQTGKFRRIANYEFCEEDYQQLVCWLAPFRRREGCAR